MINMASQAVASGGRAWETSLINLPLQAQARLTEEHLFLHIFLRQLTFRHIQTQEVLTRQGPEITIPLTTPGETLPPPVPHSEQQLPTAWDPVPAGSM